MHRATVFQFVLAALFCRAAFAAEEANVGKKAQAATQIYVRTTPPGAAVRLDGKAEGTAPGIFVVPPGVTKMTVEVELDGVKESRIIEVRGGKITRVEFALAKEGVQPTPNAHVPNSFAYEAAAAVAGEFLKAVAGGDDERALALVQDGAVERAYLSYLREEYRLAELVRESVLIAQDKARVVHTVTARDGKRRVNIELSLERRDGTWRIYASDELSAADLRSEVADGDAIRAVIAKFAALARRGENDKAIAETFTKDADEPRESVSVFLGAVAAGADPSRIKCIGMREDRAFVLTFPGFPGPDTKAGSIVYTLQAESEGWRIEDILVRRDAELTLSHCDELGGSFSLTLEFLLPAPARRNAELLDIDTGAFATMEEFGADDRVTHKWVRDHGMDALGVIEKGMAGVLLFDVATIDIPRGKWATITPEEIANNSMLTQREPDKITPCVCQPSSPVPTCIFRTREGGLGVLQVLGESEMPKGVRIRYRLASAPPSTNVEKPESRARRFVRLVVGKDAMTFQGTRTSWEELPKLLEAVPDRSRTVLEIGAASADLPVARINEAMARLQLLVQQLGFEYLSLVGVQPLESKGSSNVMRGRLDFRLAPMREEGKRLGLTEGDIERYTAELKAKGPVSVEYGKEPFVWCRLAKGVAPHARGISAERDGQSYVLLSNRPGETMLTLWGDSNPWRLVDAVLTLLDEKTLDHPSIALRLDKEGGWRMGVLTEAHVGLPLAALVDDEVLSVPTIRAKVGDAVVITGAFSKEEATELVERLKGGVSR